jgi:integrase
MAKTTARLSDRNCRTAGVGKHHDGMGLYFAVRQGAAGVTKSWLFRYKFNGKSIWMGLGSYPAITLAQARRKTADARSLLADGEDPLWHKRAHRAAFSQREAKPVPTFAECATAYIASHEAGWRGQRTHANWTRTLRDYAFPVLGHLPVNAIDRQHVLQVLQPIWLSKPETAVSVRGRVELVLGYAKALGYCDGENPAAWRAGLDHVLPARAKVAPIRHYVAMPYREVQAFMDRLKRDDAIAAACVRFAILTACRSGEAIGARWSEIDWETRTWVIPAARTKTHKEHRVPLSEAVLELLRSSPHGTEYVFPGRYGLQSHSTLRALLKRMGCSVAVHGFRASFSTWARECTSFPRELVEAALGHAVGDVVERSYQRGDALERRRELMAAWASYIDRRSAEVVQLRA